MSYVAQGSVRYALSGAVFYSGQTVPSLQEGLGGRIYFYFAKFNRRCAFPGFLPSKHWSLCHSFCGLFCNTMVANTALLSVGSFSLDLGVLTTFLDYIMIFFLPRVLSKIGETQRKNNPEIINIHSVCL